MASPQLFAVDAAILRLVGDPGTVQSSANRASDRALVRQVVADFDSEPSWIGDLSALLADEIHRELMELDDDEDLYRATLASCESVVRLFIDLIRFDGDFGLAEPPPAAVEYTHEFIRRGVSVETLLRAYSIAHAAFLGYWSERLRTSLTESDERSRAIEAGMVVSYEFINSISRGLVLRYTEGQESWIRSAAAVRVNEVHAVLRRDPDDMQASCARLGYDLGRRHVGFVVWPEGGPGQELAYGELEQIAREMVEEIGVHKPLMVPFGSRKLIGWVVVEPGDFPPPELPLPAGVGFALGTPASGLEGFRQTHAEALEAREVAHRIDNRCGVVRYRDVAIEALAGNDPARAREFVLAELGALADPSPRVRRLATTLRVYLEEQASPRRTARRLDVHENTVSNRIRAAEETLGTPIDGRVTELLVALRLIWTCD